MKRLLRILRLFVGGLLFGYALHQLVIALRQPRSLEAYAADTGELVDGIRIVPLTEHEAEIARAAERAGLSIFGLAPAAPVERARRAVH